MMVLYQIRHGNLSNDMMKKFINCFTPKYFLLIILMIFGSCSRNNRSYLTPDEKSWNPYKKGQVLVFESKTLGLDSITMIDGDDLVFPDGLGVIYYNQRLRVIATHTNPLYDRKSTTDILRISAERPERSTSISFIIKLKESQFFSDRYDLDSIVKLPEIQLSLPYRNFDDVILIASKQDYSHVPRAIKTIYWSKSKGYVKLEKYDGTTWELINCIIPI